MNAPSRVSNRLIPAVNSSGKTRMAYQGRPPAAPVPASTSRVISVAVSKPSPNSNPIGNICTGWLMAFISGRRIRVMTPRLSSAASRACASKPSVRARRKIRAMPIMEIRLRMPIRYRKLPDTEVPITPRV